ncbi:MAG: GlsB/YeaQ/YmgE family stress response membrane protein [Actinomyces succiniciruminis]|uniref:Transglycosylase associated protein n=1 Tax=Actinomyces succiniciruminis TaxID=1522002 RepID=A0A1L7RSN1_9ACTO|nr:GlsB/YeaQ/YmgE family stress response membrane protein [Actinomyces succiniciruminis]MBE6476288.1 GlsB/YeaQ/YmgE family stress response membrane protein [Actinomyces succiniciruminis]MBM6980467.1 GlsB/YeaQ/YmgE family stress response membrane protein [Actinomyces succiniciruminis]CED92434.1 Transglycosylase associated protein [Actinomyces succiniciruminis]
MGELIGMVVFGGIIGALARLIMRGDQNLSILWTIVLGAVGALVGGWLAGVLGVDATPGIDWIRWLLSLIAAMIAIYIYLAVARRR